MNNYWEGKRVLVTGGASFIGSHLCEELIRRGCSDVLAVDDLSSGKKEHLAGIIENPCFEFLRGDLFDESLREDIVFAFSEWDVVFHLAAVHGGRGYINQHNVDCSTNFALDNLCFMSAVKAGVKKIVFASSGCVLPNWMQGNPNQMVFLGDWMTPKYDGDWLGDMQCNKLIKRAYDADELYGWAKLMAEFTLQAIHKEVGIETACCRYFTAYGPRAKEDHAVMAMIARAYTQQDPFEVWGDGTQIRNWTYIDDIVNGTLLVAEKIVDGTGVNVGTMERTSVNDAAHLICENFGMVPKIKYLLDKPTGVMNRVASNELITSLGYGEFTPFFEGVKETIEWYRENKTIGEAKLLLQEGSIVNGKSR